MEQYLNKIHNKDINELLRELPDNSIDCIYSDIDYNVGIKYSGKSYTRIFGDYISDYIALASESMRVLKDTGSAKLVNEDPYGEGWILKIKPMKLDEEKDSLLTGDAAMEALKERMARDDWNCREHKGAQA